MTWNWVEEQPLAKILGSFARFLKSTTEGLSYLVSAIFGSPSKVRVLLDDATNLNKLVAEKFDLMLLIHLIGMMFLMLSLVISIMFGLRGL